MSRYDWPAGAKSPDRVAERLAWNALYRAADPAVVEEAFHERRVAETAAASEQLTVLDVPSGDENLWVPIGPATVLRGQAETKPRVSGRVRALALHTNGLRAYAGTANGGLWYTDDGGASWLPVGAFVTSRDPATGGATGAAGAQGLTVGAVHVTFGANADGSGDEVFVGTGETSARRWAGGHYGGIGVLHATGPVSVVRANPSANPWTREAKNLVGFGMYRVARNPDLPEHVVVATSRGLFRRKLPAAVDSVWDRVATGPFAAADTSDNPCRVTDVLWVKPAGAAGTRLYVAVDDLRVPGGQSGLWFADVTAAGAIGAWIPIALAGLTPSGGGTGSRLGLAAAESPSQLVYVLGLSGPMATANAAVWRVDGAAAPPVAAVVNQVPPRLFGKPGPGQHHYDLTIGVDPANQNRIVLGGSTLEHAGEHSAALFVCEVTSPSPPAFQLDYNPPGGVVANDPTWRGPGVHADVHAVAFARSAGAMWIGCDGGVYASASNGRADSFVARNTGISSIEVGYLGSNPVNDVDMVAGCQDNGTIQRIGDSVWQVRFAGDGGGVAYDPLRPDRWARQYIRANWRDNAGTTLAFVLRPGAPATNIEDSPAGVEFYSDADSVVSLGRTLLAIGTFRVWLSTTWGVPLPVPAGAPPAGAWVTLPSGRDPKATNPAETATDVCVPLPGGGPALPDSHVVTLRWAGSTRLLVLCRRAVIIHKVTDNPAAVAPAPQVTSTAHRIDQFTNGSKIKNRGSAGVAQHHLPTSCTWTDIFSHSPTRETFGSCYVATTGPEDLTAPDPPDTLWWFDGKDTWFATGLRNLPPDAPAGTVHTGTKAPAYAVVVDPDNPAIVFVGTGAGVWRGTFTVDDKKWVWAVFSNGLPEATVADLEIVKVGGVKLLRAAVHALGVYEVDLTGPGTPRTFLRVHDLDSRRGPTPPVNDPRLPLLPAPTVFRWDASPDLRPRMAVGAPAPPPPAPATPASPAVPDIVGNPANPVDAHRLWVFQTALRVLDPLVRPDGRWTNDFQARLLARRMAAGLGNVPRIDAPLWNNEVTAARCYAKPWDDPPAGVLDPGPSEADLLELVVDRPAPAGDAASIALTAGATKVEVLVHHRHALAAATGTVRVILLRHVLAASPDDGAGLPVTWTAKVAEALGSGSPPAGGWASLTDGWTVADAATPLRSPGYPVHPRTPRSVTFDVDFSAGPANSRWILVAIVASTADPVAFTGANLRDLVLRTRHAVARTVRLL